MGEFNKDRRPRSRERDFDRSGEKNFGRTTRKDSDRRDFERRDSDRPKRDFGRSSGRTEFEMHTVICAKCGRECDVPFKPTGNKPVYCRACFRKGEDSESNERSNIPSDELNRINKKLDKILKALKID